MMTCKWLKKAEEDLVVAEDELGKIPWVSAFHSQQAAEKALKALITALGKQPPKTHSIEHLLLLIEESGIDISDVREATSLSDYAVEARYPGLEEPTPEDAKEALRIARETLEWVQRKLRELGIIC